MANQWREIRFRCNTCYGASIVILIHPWKGAWAQIFAEDLYGISPWLAGGLSVKEAKVIAKKLVPYINKRYGGGESVSYMESHDVHSIVYGEECHCEKCHHPSPTAVEELIPIEE